MIKAMILAAGMGTRLRPLTNFKPKALMEVAGKTLLEITIQKILDSGIRDIVINTFHFSDQIINFLETKNYFGANVTYTVENELLDSGGGIKNAAFFLESSDCFLIHNVDIVSDTSLESMIHHHQLNKPLATLAVSNRPTTRNLVFDGSNRLTGWENNVTSEKKGKTEAVSGRKKMAFSGIHVINPKIFKLFPADKIFSIIDSYLELCDKYNIEAFEHDPANWIDAGKKEGLEAAASYLNKES